MVVVLVVVDDEEVEVWELAGVLDVGLVEAVDGAELSVLSVVDGALLLPLAGVKVLVVDCVDTTIDDDDDGGGGVEDVCLSKLVTCVVELLAVEDVAG